MFPSVFLFTDTQTQLKSWDIRIYIRMQAGRVVQCTHGTVTVKWESPTDSSAVRTRKPETCAITSWQKSAGDRTHKTTVIVKHEREEVVLGSLMAYAVRRKS